MSLLITPSTETRVNTTTASDQFYPSVTALNGGYIVTWMSLSQDGSGYGIYAQRYDATGNTVGSETRVNTTTASDQEFPTVAASFSTAAILRSSQAEKKSMTSAIRCLASERRHWPSVRASLGSFRRANKSGRSQNSNNYLRFRAEGSFNRSYFGGS